MTDSITYIAFLRAINVGGHTVKMERLRQLFTELGFTNVRTFIQSGNVFFESEGIDQKLLADKIEARLTKALGYEVPVVLRTIEALDQLIQIDPFKHIELTDDKRFCVAFAAVPLPQNLPLPLRTPKNDMEIIAITEREAFVVWHLINGRPPSAGNFLDKTLAAKTTTRFWHTTQKILQAAKSNIS